MTEDNKIHTIFFGAGNFAVKILENLLSQTTPIFSLLDIVAIVTQPDKEAGRKKILTPPPVKKFVQSMNVSISLLQPVSLKTESAQILADFKPELIIVADYGQIIPNNIIDFPKYKCLNIHGSILPKYRGAVPAAMAILNGDKKTGVTIPVMAYKLDDGDVLGFREIDILDTDTTYSLRMRLADVGNELLNEILPKWIEGKITPVPQDATQASFTWERDLDKEKALINSSMPIDRVEKMVRAFSPWPITWANIKIDDKVKRLKIYKAQIVNSPGIASSGAISPEVHTVGEIFKHDKKLYLKFEDGILELQEIQLEGKKVLPGAEYLFLDHTLLVNA